MAIDLSYPIGPFVFSAVCSDARIEKCIGILNHTPERVKTLYHAALADDKLLNTYRDGGWNVAQIIHHMADSHINAFTRFKLALTEDHPTLKPYREAMWAMHQDYAIDLLPCSISILEGVHRRLVRLVENLTEESFQRKILHPGSQVDMSVHYLTEMYAWHSSHHCKHLEIALVGRS